MATIRICEKCNYNKTQLERHDVESYDESKIYFTDCLYNNVDVSDDVKMHVLDMIDYYSPELHNTEDFDTYVKDKSEEEYAKYLGYLKTFPMTTGFEFTNCKIIKYCGIVSGTFILGTGFINSLTAEVANLVGVESQKIADKLDSAREFAALKLVERAIEYGANSIIGVDFDYVNFAGVFSGVIANGTAVVTDKCSILHNNCSFSNSSLFTMKQNN